MKNLFCFVLIIVMLSACACCFAEAGDPENADLMEAMNIVKLEDYLYTITIDDYDYAYGMSYTHDMFYSGGCAAIRNGNFRGRNYDWTYDDTAYFVISTPAKDGRHAVLGVAGTVASLTNEVVESGEWNNGYRDLPFATLDGINDCGLVSTILVVPNGEAGQIIGSNPDGEELSASMINRYVLDYASDVDEAIELLRNRNVYMPHTAAMDQEFHWMISDPERTVVIEFVNNEMTVLEGEEIATNFYLYNFDKTGKTVQRVPEGIERYNIIADGYASTASAEGMMEMLKTIRYSRTYDLKTVPFWYSEYSGGELDSSMFGDPDISDGDLSRAGGYAEEIASGQESWAGGRNNNTWITVYSSVYDMENLTLSVCPQEGGNIYDFAMNIEG